MSTSNSYDWSLNRDQAILMALQEINVYGELDTVADLQADTGKYTFCINKLNGMLKTWSVDGVKAPKRKIGYVFPVIDQKEYKLGTISGSSHITNTYVSTTISANEAALQTVISLTSTTGMTAADFIGIELDNGTRHWTTIVSVDSAIQVTITTAITSAATAANTVLTYTSKFNRPLDILYATKLNLVTDAEMELSVYGHDEYNKMPSKDMPGSVINMYYDKQIAGARPNYSSLFVYPRPNLVNEIIRIVYTDSIQDLDGATDDIDLPSEWLETVYMNLAARLCFPYGKIQEFQTIAPVALDMYKLLKSATYDSTPIKIRLKRS